MQQRVALARALVNLPKVLLLDEPLGALDLKLRKGLQVELKRIQREVGITFVYVTHDQEEALTMSDRIAVMNHGRVEQVGDPEEVYERPDDHLRRRLHRRLQPDAGDGRPASGEVQLDSGPDDRAPTPTASRPASAATRWSGPRSCGSSRSAPTAPATALPRVEGIVESSVYLGTDDPDGRRPRRGGADDRALSPTPSEAERQSLPGGGARVALSWEPEHMHLVRESPDGASPNVTRRADEPVGAGNDDERMRQMAQQEKPA